jgi:sugar transferase (PEP-CTERM/EpsH1 system associated)
LTPQRPLICHIILRLAVGGLENGLVNLINNLPIDAYAHAIVCIDEATEFRRRIERGDVEIHEIHKRPGKDIGAYGRVWRVLRQLKPQLVHTRNLPALDMIAPAWLAGVRKLVHSEHGLDLMEIEGKSAKYNRLRRLSRFAVDRYIAVSADLSSWLRNEIGVPNSRLETIYNGVDTRRFFPDPLTRSILPEGFAPTEAVVVGTLGRLDPLKNQLALVDAFARLLTRNPALREKLRLVIAGEGESRSAIEMALSKAGISDLAWLPGVRNDTVDFYRSIDIFVLPSLREGISNTLLEAMASGLPVIAARVGGNPEIVPDGVAGQLVAAADPEMFAAAIWKYIEHPVLMREHGKAGRAHMLGNFSLEKMVERYDRVYRSLL